MITLFVLLLAAIIALVNADDVSEFLMAQQPVSEFATQTSRPHPSLAAS